MTKKQTIYIIIIALLLGGLLVIFSNTNEGQEATVVEFPNATTTPVMEKKINYIQIVDSCNHNYAEIECVKAYSRPATTTPVADLRKGMVLTVGEELTKDGEDWYKITFEDQFLHYPERITSDWYVKADEVEPLYDEGVKTIEEDGRATTTKKIIVSRSGNTLSAYEGDELYMETNISSGVELSPTPLGTYEVFRKMPSRYMQGPLEGIPGSDYYDLQGVPWNLYFTAQGAVIHGAYWHDSFGSSYSHGCVNMQPSDAKLLYDWAVLGTVVEIRP